jgi:hypothetical protein
MRRNNRKSGGFTLAETLMIGFLVLAAIIGVIATIEIIVMAVTPTYPRSGHSTVNACINNLRLIDGAKSQWAMEHNKQITDTPTASDIQPYMGHGPHVELPVCPNDPKRSFATSYSPNNVGSKPVCRIMPTNHVLP